MGNVEASSAEPREANEPQHQGQSEPVRETNANAVNTSPDGVELGDDGERPGLIREDGSINWDCPCLGGMANGPCGEEFKAAFSCFHYSTAEQKGSDCLEPFMAMQNCFQKYPEIFGPKEGEEEDDELSEPYPNSEHQKGVSDADKSPKKERLNEPEKQSVLTK